MHYLVLHDQDHHHPPRRHPRPQARTRRAEHTSRTKSDVIRDCLRRQLSVEIMKLVRQDLVPLAEKQGIYTDEDVFEFLKRDPATGVIAGLEPDHQRSNPRRGTKSSASEAAPDK